MKSLEKEVSYQTINTYSTLNSLTDFTKNIWFVCHGLGYLSKYFINYFKQLDVNENFIVAPQAPSKYYQTKEYKHVGASWLTKENTVLETQNIFNYFDAVFESEIKSINGRLICLGYSQGVSVLMRYLAARQLHCDELIIHSGSIPNELTSQDFNYFKGNVSLVYGLKDPYLTEKRMASEREKLDTLFGKNYKKFPFDGVHEMNPQLVEEIVS